MTDLSPRARDVLADARAELAPDADRIARGRDRLLAATAMTAAGAAAAHATATASTGAAGTSATGVAGLKLFAIGASLVVIVAGAIVVPRLLSRSTPARPATTAEAPARGALPAPDRPADRAAANDESNAIDPAMIELEPNVADAEAHPKRARHEPTGSVTVPVPVSVTVPVTGSVPVSGSGAVDPLTRELQLLRAARTGLRNSATVDALSILATYQREFPHGQLAEEAAALELDLLCAAGRADQVVRQRARFLDRWPSSALRQRVERVCQPR